jgi:hypothetical protein
MDNSAISKNAAKIISDPLSIQKKMPGKKKKNHQAQYKKNQSDLNLHKTMIEVIKGGESEN